MADVATMMAYGLPARQAQAVEDHATLGVNGLVALGFQAELAKLIMGTPTTEQLMALGMPANQAVAVKAVVNP